MKYKKQMMRDKQAGTYAVSFAILILGLVGAGVVFLYNPLNWGVTTSASFSMARFSSIEAGMHIDDVIAILGEPLGVAHGLPRNMCRQEAFCSNYVFAGTPVAWWVLAYKKAWVIVDKDGLVIRTHLYSEP